MDEEVLKSRAVGLIMLCAGVILTYWNYSMRVNEGTYYPQLAFIGPCLISLAINFVIEAPKLPVTKPSVLGKVCVFSGVGFGLWNAIF